MKFNAIAHKERVTKIIKNIIMKYDGIFDPTNPNDAEMLASEIVRRLKANKFLVKWDEWMP